MALVGDGEVKSRITPKFPGCYEIIKMENIEGNIRYFISDMLRLMLPRG